MIENQNGTKSIVLSEYGKKSDGKCMLNIILTDSLGAQSDPYVIVVNIKQKPEPPRFENFSDESQEISMFQKNETEYSFQIPKIIGE